MNFYTYKKFTFFDDGEIKEQPKLEVGYVSKQRLFNLISQELILKKVKNLQKLEKKPQF